MDYFSRHFLVLLTLLPAAGAAAVMAAPGRRLVRWTAIGVAGLAFFLSLLLPLQFDWHAGRAYADAQHGGIVQLIDRSTPLPLIHVRYFMGVDGLSLPLVLVAALIFLFTVLACPPETGRTFFARLLLLETLLLGAFLSLDFIFFWAFFSLCILPLHLLIRPGFFSWKQPPGAKFLLYAGASSLLMLLALAGAHARSGATDLLANASAERGAAGGALFIMAVLSLLLRLGVAPFHTWWMEALAEAPAPVAMVLPLVLLSGGYGLFRVAYPLFPGVAAVLWAPLAALAIVGMMYAALVSLSQLELKPALAYSAAAQAALIPLGAAVLTPASASGACFAMVAYAITMPAVWLLACVLTERTGEGQTARLGARVASMPVARRFAAIILLSAGGLPLLCGFVGPILVIAGTFQAVRADSILASQGHAAAATVYIAGVLACGGFFLHAASILWIFHRLVLGRREEPAQRAAPVTGIESAVLGILIACMILLGTAPTPLFFTQSGPTVSAWLEKVRAPAAPASGPPAVPEPAGLHKMADQARQPNAAME